MVHLGTVSIYNLYACLQCKELFLINPFLKVHRGRMSDGFYSMLFAMRMVGIDDRLQISLKYAGKCKACGKWLHEGESAYWKKDSGIVCCACYVKLKDE